MIAFLSKLLLVEVFRIASYFLGTLAASQTNRSWLRHPKDPAAEDGWSSEQVRWDWL